MYGLHRDKVVGAQAALGKGRGGKAKRKPQQPPGTMVRRFAEKVYAEQNMNRAGPKRTPVRKAGPR